MTTFTLEETDTFGREANYCWCHREELTVPDTLTDLALVRRAKATMGWSGVRCRREDHGEIIALYPHGSNTVLFIIPNY